MTDKQIKDFTAESEWNDTNQILMQESGGTTKRILMSILRKIIPASDSTTAFQVMKADGTTAVLDVNTTSGRLGVNTASPTDSLDVVGGARFRNFGSNFSQYFMRSNGTIASPTAVLINEATSILYFSGFGATTLVFPASIRVSAEEQYTDTTAATRFVINTCPTGSVTAAESFRLTGAGAAYFPRIATTASAANAFLDSGTSNSLLRSTSSARYKTDVEPIADEYSEKIYDLNPIWYRSLADADNKDWSWYGLLAEEVAKVEPRLVHYAYKEEDYEYIEKIDGEDKSIEKVLKDGSVKVPDGVQYERLTVLMLAEMKKMKARIDELEALVK